MNYIPPLVSIGIPTFNRSDTLVKCLESVLRQTYKNIEVIVSDNLSSDSTPDVCQEFENRDSRVKTWRQASNIGGIPNFDFVRMKAQGNYFMLLGDDDWIDTNLIQSCVQFLENNSDYIAAGGRTIYYREDGVKFEGSSLSIGSDTPGIRVLDTISNVIDGGLFYALYRAEPANQIPYIEAWGSDYYFLFEAAFLGKIETLQNVACHRIDNSHKISINEYLRSSAIVSRQDLDPYGTIASVFFWRIVATGNIFKQLENWDRLQLAANAVEIVSERWQITGQADLLKIASEVFADQDLITEYRSLRSSLVLEWTKAANKKNEENWDNISPVLNAFIKLGFTGSSENMKEFSLLYGLGKTAATIENPRLKNAANKMIGLFF